MGKHDKYRSSSPSRESHRYKTKSEDEEEEYRRSEKKHKEKKKYDDDEDENSGDEYGKVRDDDYYREKERRKREKEEKKEKKRKEKGGHGGGGHEHHEGRHGEHGRPSSRSESREHERGFPGEHGGYGRYQESQGYGERPNVQVYGHTGYGGQAGYSGQPQTYQSPPPPSGTYQSPTPPGGAYGQEAYGSGQGVYAYQPTSPPPVQYQPPGYQQPAHGGGGAYSGAYQTGPSPAPPPQAGYSGAYQEYQPPGPPPQTYGYHPQEQPGYEYRPQEQPATYGGYSSAPQQGPYAHGYQPPPGPPPGTPGYHPAPPPPGPSYGAPSHYPSPPPPHGYAAPPPVSVGVASAGHHYKPQHHSAQQQQGYQGTDQYGSTTSHAAAIPPAQVGTNINPAHPSAKPTTGFATSALNTFTTALNSSLHGYARTLFPATSTHKPTVAQYGVTGDSGAPAQTTEHRFDSFAPVRGGNGAKWYVDGKDYMYAVSIALERAQESIWILDWWLSPELYLRRPPAYNQQYRLDNMLKAAAKRGVKVNIIVYKEVTQALTRKSLKPILSPYISSLLSKHTPSSSKLLSFLSSLASEIALPLAFDYLEKLEAKYPLLYPSDASGFTTVNSHHTKHWLEDLHPNIGVFRHPDHLPDRPTILQDISNKITTGTYSIGDGLKGLYGINDGVVLFWAHHEKLCLVDGEIAFMGGLDLCFGRWDMNHHPLADAHPGDLNAIVFPGQDYNDARFMDFHSVEKWEENKVSRTEHCRLGWTDVALSVIGPTVKDLQRHFMDRWNFIYLEKYKVRNDPRFQLIDEKVLREPGYHRRKMKDHVKGVGQAFLEGAGSRHYEQEERAYGHDNSGRYNDLAGVQCQIVRSASKWSHGIPATEHSIAHAYIEIISAAKHFVYIENQFFITATDDKQSPIINKIGRAIVDRVLRAANAREKFRVVVIIPAVPAFAGDLQDEASLGTRAIMEFQYRSICNDRGYSIMEQIAKAGVDPKQYIRFYNLRNYDRINVSKTMEQGQQASGISYNAAAASLDQKVGGGYGGYSYGSPQPDAYSRYQRTAPGGDEWDSVAKCCMLHGGDIRNVPWNGDPDKELDAFVSEELYIHSKLLIADDRIVICGSANLNDRSQLGDHDSEIAIVIDDPTPLPSYMDGRPYQASHFAATLRRQIFRKHLGLIPAQNLNTADENMEPVPTPNIYDFDSAEDQLVADPLGDRFWNFWNETAKINTGAFGKAFHPVPHDSVTNWRIYNEWYTKYFTPTKEEKERVERVNKERLAAAGGNKEKMVEEKARPPVEWGHVVKAEFPGGVWELKELLSRIRGHLVEMPLDFLKEEDIAKEGLGLNALTETLYT